MRKILCICVTFIIWMSSLRPMQLEFEVFPDHNKHCRLSFNEHWAHVKIFNIAISKTCFCVKWKSNIFYLNKCWLICSYISDDIQAEPFGVIVQAEWYTETKEHQGRLVSKNIQTCCGFFLNEWTNTFFCSDQGTVPKHAPRSREYLKRICAQAADYFYFYVWDPIKNYPWYQISIFRFVIHSAVENSNDTGKSIYF